MLEQYDLCGNVSIPPKKQKNNLRRAWENGFQRWSNDHAIHDDIYSFGKCGCGTMCDYCTDNSYGRPCVRALGAMCREKNIEIDYTKKNYEDIWEGKIC